MTEKEDIILWNFVVATYSSVKQKLKNGLGTVGFMEQMLKEAKSIELCVQEKFSRESLSTTFEI